MNKNYLLESAGKLKQVGKEVSEEYSNKSQQLIVKMNSTMQERPDIKSLVGDNNISMMEDNHANHVRFIGSILKNHNPEVLVNTVLWVFRAYQSHGFKSNYWSAQLNTWLVILKELLSEEGYNEIYPYYEWMQINIPVFVKASEENIDSSKSSH